MSGMAVLDPDVVAQLAEDLPPGVFARIVTTFEADLELILPALAGAVTEPVAFARAAHTLAGAAGSIGARTLAELARRGMAMPEEEDRAILVPLLRAEARAAIDALRKRAGGPA